MFTDDFSNQQEAGTEIEPMGDLNTEAEKKLGRLVKEKYECHILLFACTFINTNQVSCLTVVECVGSTVI